MKILSFVCDPGVLKTDLQRHASAAELPDLGFHRASDRTFKDLMLRDASYGALTQLWAGTMEETIQHNGQV